VKGIGNINCRRNAGSLHADGEKENSATIANTVKLNRRDIRKPARFRRLAVSDMDYGSVQPVGGASKRVRRPRTEAEKLRRREINHGPFSCPYCTRPPFQHRSGFRRHIILTHRMHCSWSGAIRPFADEVEETRVHAVLVRGGQHRRRCGNPRGVGMLSVETQVMPSVVASVPAIGSPPEVAAVDPSSVGITVATSTQGPAATSDRENTGDAADITAVGTTSLCRRLYGTPELPAVFLDGFDRHSPRSTVPQSPSLTFFQELGIDVVPSALPDFDWSDFEIATPTAGVDATSELVVSPMQTTRDVATMAVPTTDAAVQVQADHRHRGTQTPAVDLYLPPGVSINRLLDLVFTNTDSSARAIATSLSREQSQPLPDERYVALETVVYAMIETQRHLLNVVADSQRRVRLVGLDTDEANGIMSRLHSYVGALQGRPYSELTTQRRQPQEFIGISDDSAVHS
jgi:hypothetical protein